MTNGSIRMMRRSIRVVTGSMRTMRGCVAPSPRASADRLCAAIRLINSSLSASPAPSTSAFVIHCWQCSKFVCEWISKRCVISRI